MTEYSTIERSTNIQAQPTAILAELVDFRRWPSWSPWEGLDPDLKRNYTGPESGPGSAYEWSGNRKAGAGRMEIAAADADSVDIALTFTRPFKSKSRVRFELTPGGDSTELLWRMLTPKTLGMRIAGLFMNMDARIGGDLEKGLARLRSVVERS